MRAATGPTSCRTRADLRGRRHAREIAQTMGASLMLSCTALSVLLVHLPCAHAAAPGEPRIYVCFRNDDLSALSDVDHERSVMEIFDRYQVRQTIGVIPYEVVGSPRDPLSTVYLPLSENAAVVAMLREWIQQARVEVALHGCTHQANRFVSVPSRSEFAEFRGLSYRDQLCRIRCGQAICQTALRVKPDIFIPPWNEWDANTVRACLDAGILALSADRHVAAAPGLLSINANCELADFGSALATARQGDRAVLIVVLYHTRTIRDPKELALLESVVATAAAADDVRIVTLGEVASKFSGMASLANAAGRDVARQDRDVNRDRGAAFLYRRLARAMGIRLKLESLYEDARIAYLRGAYEQSIAISPTIDRECSRVVLVARAAIAFAGLLYGALLLLVLGHFVKTPLRIALSCICIIIITGLPGLGMALWAIAPVTRAEMLFASGFLVGGAFIGVALAIALALLVKRSGVRCVSKVTCRP